MSRAAAVHAAPPDSYSQSKQFLLDSGYFRDDILCHFCASMISGPAPPAASSSMGSATSSPGKAH
ncbi:hypothetical protein, partial [Salmonella enterica]|uniref:hypothetical protein n=1 Tax=Salmonella enterica TaxID=28901 RepID=UPI001FAD94A7